MLSETQLLNHIYQTAEMGQDGIQSVLKYADEPKLLSALNAQMTEYRKLQDSAGEMLRQRQKEPQGISPMAKVGSEMMIQGPTMGVTKSIRTIRDCELKDERVRDLANKLLDTEYANIEEMKKYL